MKPHVITEGYEARVAGTRSRNGLSMTTTVHQRHCETKRCSEQWRRYWNYLPDLFISFIVLLNGGGGGSGNPVVVVKVVVGTELKLSVRKTSTMTMKS